MRVVVTSKLPYKREFQYYHLNQFVILDYDDRVIVEHICSENEIVYYYSLVVQGFEVCFQDDDGKCICDKVKIEHPCLCNPRGMSKASSDIMRGIELEDYIRNLAQ